MTWTGSSQNPNDEPDNSNSKVKADHANPRLLRSPDIPVETQATSFFFANYVFSDPSMRNGFNAYMPLVFGNSTDESPVTSVVLAIGLAGLGSTRASPAAQRASLAKYAMALNRVNNWLQDPRKAIMDETLIAIHLLGLYEVSWDWQAIGVFTVN